MKKLTIALAAAAVLVAPFAWGETSDVPLFVWLLIEPGSRPGGIGKTFTGLADDANAAYYNPGGLALQEKNGVTVMHEPRGTEELKDIFYDYVAFAYRTGKYGTLGVDVVYSDAGKSDMTDDQGRVIGVMHIYGAAPSVFWSYPLRKDLGLGAGLTYAYEHLTDQPGGVDQQLLFNGGVLYKTPLKGLSGGLTFNKIGTNESGTRVNEEKQVIKTSYSPPRTVRLGLAYNVFSSDLNDLTVAADGSKLLMNLNEGLSEEFRQGIYSGGAEYTYAKMVGVRLGYYSYADAEIKGLTLGFGFAYKGLSFDYARIPEGDVFGDRHRFAVGYVF
jgi:hypothetical protein